MVKWATPLRYIWLMLYPVNYDTSENYCFEFFRDGDLRFFHVCGTEQNCNSVDYVSLPFCEIVFGPNTKGQYATNMEGNFWITGLSSICLIVASSAIDKMFEIFGPILEQNANVNFEQNVNFGPIFEKNANFSPIFVKSVNFEHFVNGRWGHY